jgi:16S rRNA (uracil1498-N3)-methyltransferase
VHWFYDPSLTLESNSLPQSEALHALKSLRVVSGEKIAITNGNGKVIQAQVELASKTTLEYKPLSEENFERTSPEIVLIQALAKGDRDELALQSCVELGLSAALPWPSERSVVKWSGDKITKGLARWQQIAIEAMKQSQQPFLCSVSGVFNAESALPGRTLVLDPTSPTSLLEIDTANAARINLVVGPEGGISPVEMEHFGSLGYERVRLGDAVMRTSTAGPAAISAIRTLLNNW